MNQAASGLTTNHKPPLNPWKNKLSCGLIFQFLPWGEEPTASTHSAAPSPLSPSPPYLDACLCACASLSADRHAHEERLQAQLLEAGALSLKILAVEEEEEEIARTGSEVMGQQEAGMRVSILPKQNETWSGKKVWFLRKRNHEPAQFVGFQFLFL